MRFRKSRQRSLISQFESEFAVEILRCDRLRVNILIGFVASTILMVLVLSALSFEEFQATFHGNFRRFLLTMLLVAGLNLSCLILERLAIDYLQRNRGKTFAPLQYLSAFFETSIPTAGIIVGSLFLGPVYTLFTPATLVYPLFIVLAALRLDFKLCVFTGAVAGLEYAAVSLFLLSQANNQFIEPILSRAPHHLFKGFLLFAAGVVTGLVTLQIKQRILKSFEMIEERNRINRTFGEYVSPAVVEKLLTLKPDLRSERRSVCVMFLDIRNFTTFAEKKEPEEVVAYLESLFEFMIEIINRHHGVINKFLGDGFMAVFGAPLSEGSECANGVAAGREILLRVEEEVARGSVLPTRVGIGLHSGEALTGSIGSSLRREYTVIGDVVNLASRIEQLNKRFDSRMLISEMVWQTLNGELREAIPMGQVQVKGRERAIQVYQVA